MRACGQSGFTLVEVLVALLVLSLGLVGSARMQLTAMRTRQQSALLSSAVQLASSMADRMRANTAEMARADGANPYLNVQYDANADGAPQAPPALCLGTGACTSSELAGADVYDLKRQLHSGMPGGRVVICRDGGAWGAASAAPTWDCDGAAASPIVIKLGWRARPDGAPRDAAALPLAPAVALMVALP